MYKCGLQQYGAVSVSFDSDIDRKAEEECVVFDLLVLLVALLSIKLLGELAVVFASVPRSFVLKSFVLKAFVLKSVVPKSVASVLITSRAASVLFPKWIMLLSYLSTRSQVEIN